MTVPLSLSTRVRELAAETGGESSEPQPASSTADPLNAPLSGGDIQAAAEVITAVFGAGLAAVKFLEELLKLSKDKDVRVKATNVSSKATLVLKDAEDIAELLNGEQSSNVSDSPDRS